MLWILASKPDYLAGSLTNDRTRLRRTDRPLFCISYTVWIDQKLKSFAFIALDHSFFVQSDTEILPFQGAVSTELILVLLAQMNTESFNKRLILNLNACSEALMKKVPK